MNRLVMIILGASLVMPIAFLGCKGKPKGVSEMPAVDMQAGVMPANQDMQVFEPAANVASETIPPTASPALEPKQASVSPMDRSKDIQTALRNSGFYSGPIDGKIGPKTRKAVMDFQGSKGLKVDGKVGPKTWAELEKYLMNQ